MIRFDRAGSLTSDREGYAHDQLGLVAVALGVLSRLAALDGLPPLYTRYLKLRFLRAHRVVVARGEDELLAAFQLVCGPLMAHAAASLAALRVRLFVQFLL